MVHLKIGLVDEWQVVGVENGECWEEITKAYYNVLVGDPKEPSKPKIVYCKTRKGEKGTSNMISIVMVLRIK